MAPNKGFKPLTLKPVAFSLTDGTDIPPPPPSPPPVAQVPAAEKFRGALSSHPAGSQNEQDVEMKDADTTHSNGDGNGAMLPPSSTRHISPSPASPTSTTNKRPSSVRKLLSFKSLREREGKNQMYSANGLPSPQGKMSTDSYHIPTSRPGSPYSVAHDSAHSLTRKRSSGWFGSRRRSTFILDQVNMSGGDDENGGAVQPPVRKGPPPPTLPELRELGSLNGALNDGLGADDLFKNIK